MAKPLKQIGIKHSMAVRLRIAGASPAQIARELGVQRRTVYLWFSDPLVKAEVAARLERVNERVAEQLAASTLAALHEREEIPDRSSEEPTTFDLKLRVICETLDPLPSRTRRTEEH